MEKHSATVFKDTVQTLTFDPTKFTPEQAKQWISEQDFELIDFTEASGSARSAKPAKKTPAKKTVKK